MAKVRLLNGPCDPREVEMPVAVDADAVLVRPVPFHCSDVYAVMDRFIDNDIVYVATCEYLHTDGARRQTDAYRKALLKIGAGRAFRLKRQHVHA